MKDNNGVFGNTHNFWREAGAVGEMSNRVIEVVQICLVVGLELMKEVEEFICEDSMWSG
jgi:hypothetical protein